MKKHLYVVMEMCAGPELLRQMSVLKADQYTEDDCCRVLHQIAHGVQYMHEMGLVFRDLGPANILCMVPGSIEHVKICDFGISQPITDHHRLRYVAPEILSNDAYDFRVDFWSVGII